MLSSFAIGSLIHVIAVLIITSSILWFIIATVIITISIAVLIIVIVIITTSITISIITGVMGYISPFSIAIRLHHSRTKIVAGRKS